MRGGLRVPLRHSRTGVATLAALALLASGAAAATDPNASLPAVAPDVARLADGAPSPTLGPPAAQPRASLEGEVAAALAEQERVPVIVRLRQQADLPAVAARARALGRTRGRAARVREVVEELQRTAAGTQPGVAGLLRAEEAAGRARGVRSFWIFNGFAAEVSRAALERLAEHPDVESVTLDEELSLPEVETKPRLPTWGLEQVNAPRAWGDYGFTGEGVVVGVMDSGVDGGHPAVASRWRGRNGDAAASWYVPTGENYATPGDGHGHGTHVTGTIVGGPPGEVVGVAPDAEWIAVKIFRDSGSTSTSIIHDGFQWMLAPGGDPSKAPDVVNNSWGSTATLSTEFLEDVRAWVAAGIFPAFANGNNGPGRGTVGSPASFPESFGVGATDSNDQVAWFSSRGPVTWDGLTYVKPQVSAPGHEITSSWPRQLGAGDYNTISGTSMATPHVTGVVALLLSAQPSLSVHSIRELLTSTARREPHMGRVPNYDYGAGIVDAYAAITAARFSGDLVGTVTGPNGPIAATVAIPELGLETTSDATTGFYELRVKEGSWRVEVSAYGYGRASASVEMTARGEVTRDFELASAPTHTLSGTVSALRSPVAGARVRVVGTPLPPVYTRADGSFSLPVAAGEYDVSADATGYTRASERVTLDGDRSVTLELEPLTGAVATGWSEYQNNPARTGLSADELAAGALEQSWSVDLTGQVMFASPAVAGGRIHLAFDNGQLRTLDLDTGELLWSFGTGTSLRSTPAVADGRVYVGGGDSGRFHALSAATGAPVWTFETGDRLTYTAPTVVDGTVFFGTGWGEGNGGWVYALDAATGALRWKTFVGAEIYFAPAVGGGRVYAASYDAQKLVALDAASGDELWSLARTTDSFAAMPSYDGGRLYVATNNFDTGVGSVLAVDAETGVLLWEAAGHGDAAGNAPVPFGNVVVAGSSLNNWVVAYDRETGERRWVHSVGAAVSNSQLAADGVLVGGSQQDRRVWALDAYTGELLWEDTLTDNVLSAPAFADGRLVVAARNGVVRAYEAPGTVSGAVTDPHGRPLAAEVRVPDTGASVRTDPATGVFELSHRPGTYTVEAYAYGYLVARAELRVRSGQPTRHDFELAAAATGSLRGVVRDEAGGPLAGVSVALPGTPLEAVATGDDGAFAFAAVAAGTYELTATLAGYVPFARNVTVEPDAETTVDVTLLEYEIAVTGDRENALTRLLTSKGYRVESTAVAAIADRPGDYRLIVANGAQDDPGEEVFERFVAKADAAETSVIFLDTWGISYGSLYHLWRYLGDPAEQGSGFSDGEVSLVARGDHPLTAGLTPGARVEALPRNHEYAWFSGYAGRTVADVYVGEQGRIVGGGVGFQPRTLGSAHVLLSLHGASPWTGPTQGWTTGAHQVFDNAVAYALDATYGAVEGAVATTDGAPLAASVIVAETGDAATADAAGRYRLLLPPGTYTLRFAGIGYTSEERSVTVAARGTETVDVQLAQSGAGGVAGRITSAADGSPIAGAEVLVLDSGVPAAATGADGRYAVDGVPAGTYDVRVGAQGFRTHVETGVVVEDGSATDVSIALERRLRVAVLGDSSSRLTTFLNANELEAIATQWEAFDALDSYDVVVLNDPTDPGEAAFLAHLEALDTAGKSAIFIEGPFSSDGGVRLLQRYLGEPTTRANTSSGNIELEARDPAHPLFEGLPARVQVLAEGERGAYFDGYSGIPIADFRTSTLGTLGLGAAYEPRTPTSVRLLLGALATSIFASPSAGWTDEGGRLFLNALEWAAAPGLGAVAGRVADESGAPLGFAQLRIVETGQSVDASSGGSYVLPHAPGDFTLEVRAFGYTTSTIPVRVEANRTLQLDVELAVGAVGAIAGAVTSRGTIAGAGDAPGPPIEGAEVTLVGHPRATTTAADGSYALPNVEPGTYEVEISANGFVRSVIRDVVVAVGETARRDAALRPSPRVAVIDDCQQSAACTNKLQAFLAHWGYTAEEIGWDDFARIAAVDLVVANLGDFPRLDPGAAGLAAFQDAVNRAHVPVVWLEQFQRGSIRWLRAYENDPATVGEDRSDGLVEAEIVAEHPLTAGFSVGERVPISTDEHTWFEGYSGTVVANIRSANLGVRGGGIAYRGRTASSVDILFSTFAATINTWPRVGGEEGETLTPQAERLFHNALEWALDAPPLAGEARGVVRSSAGGPIAATVEVVQTEKTHPARAGDGAFVVPLQPGDWTLEISAFGHEPRQVSVSVAAGTVRQLDVVLTSHAVGSLAGTVTDEAGAPVEGASIVLEGTPLSARSDAVGSFRIDNVPVGEYTVLVRGAGLGQQRLPVTIAAGAAARLDVRLAPSRTVAVAGDFQSSLTSFLTENGYAVTQWSWADVHQHVDDLDDVELVILNGSGTNPTAAEFQTFIAAANAAGRSVILAGQSTTGAIGVSRTATGDPATVTGDFAAGWVYYRPIAGHPIFEGFPTGEPVNLMRNPTPPEGTLNQQYQFFSGYSGTAVAVVGADADGGDRGNAVAFRFTSPTSVHVLLATLGATTQGRPGERWTADAERIYLNAVEWALDVAQAQIFGTVRSDGDPVGDALVEAVGTGFDTRSGADGSYRLGVPGGTHTVRVTALGYEPFETTVTVGDEERVQLDVELTATARGAVAGTVVDAVGAPIAAAAVEVSGPSEGETTTGADGTFAFDDLLPGQYTLEVTAAGYLAQSVSLTVEGGETSEVEITLRGNDVAVLGDVDGVLVDFLRANGVPADERAWDAIDAHRYEVIVVNGGDPTAEQFEAVVDAADAAGTSLVFTGTWGILNGGIRLLAAHRPDEVAIGGHGYRHGAVELTDFDPAHPVFSGLAAPLSPLAADSYYSFLDEYVGPYLARLVVGARGPLGVSVAYDFRSAGSVHLLLSAGAVSGLIGPGYGWTRTGERLFLNAIEWARDVEQTAPAAPTLTAPAPLVAATPITLRGTAEFRSTVTIRRNGAAVGEATPARDGAFSAELALEEGPNVFTATARNYAGDSAASSPATVTLDTTGPVLEWTPADRSGFFSAVVVVAGTATDAHAGVAAVLVNGAAATLTEDGRFAADVRLSEGATTLTVTARDRLANETTETRRVAFFPYSTRWVVAGAGGQGELIALLDITDPAATAVQADSVTAELVDADGEVAATAEMRYGDGRYRANLGRPAPGEYTLRAVAVVEGWNVRIAGPTVVRAGDRSRAGAGPP